MLFPVSFIFLVFGGFAIWAREWPIVWLLLSVVVIFVLAGLGCLRLGKRMVADEMSRG
jgi:ABC-type bacteriocin/lantibiotic exporter with double-glycine peptidase domain